MRWYSKMYLAMRNHRIRFQLIEWRISVCIILIVVDPILKSPSRIIPSVDVKPVTACSVSPLICGEGLS